MDSGESDNLMTESICDYVARQNLDDPVIMSLCESWQNICRESGIDLSLRHKMDEWFMQCYESRSRVEGLSSSGSVDAWCESDNLYQQFLADLDQKVKHEEFFYKQQLKTEKKKIEDKYGQKHEAWVEQAILCVKKEQQLLASHKQAHKQVEMEAAPEESREDIDRDIENIKLLQQDISSSLKSLDNTVKKLSSLCRDKDQLTEQLSDLHQLRNSSKSNGINSCVPDQHFQSKVTNIQASIQQSSTEINRQHQVVVTKFNNTHQALVQLVQALKLHIIHWKRELQLDYAEMCGNPDLSKLAAWCGDTGQVLHDMVHENMSCWENIITSIPVEVTGANSTFHNGFSQFHDAFQKMLLDFIQSTFLVTSQKGKEIKNSPDQKGFCIKRGTKKFPLFTVRILAADRFIKSEVIFAYFIWERDLNQCYHDNDLDLAEVKRKSIPLQQNKMKITKEKKAKDLECCFQNLQFEDPKFKKADEGQLQVHEQLYRVVFVSKFMSTDFWTLSLPLVVVSGSNQEAHGLASVMWQCFFNDDVFSLPIQEIHDMPWCRIADMLQCKILRLSNHRLTPANLDHLKYRLLGEEAYQPDDCLPAVSLTKFCWTAMDNMDVSFWHWFLGIYNLLEQYLQDYWKDGLIMGFVKKEDAIRMLQSKDVKAGTFILRFSDNHLTKSQGLRTVYGRITSCVTFMKYVKGGKRNAAGQSEMCMFVDPVELPDYRKLDNLANILRDTTIKGSDGTHMYQFLYPRQARREELFDKYCREGDDRGLFGYQPIKDAYVALVEQQLAKLSVGMCDGSTSLASGQGPQSVKKARKRNQKGSSRGSISSQSDRFSEMSSPNGSPMFSPCPSDNVGSPLSIQSTQSTCFPVTCQVPAQSQHQQGASQHNSHPNTSPAIQSLQGHLINRCSSDNNTFSQAYPGNTSDVSCSQGNIPTIAAEIQFPVISLSSLMSQQQTPCQMSLSDMMKTTQCKTILAGNCVSQTDGVGRNIFTDAINWMPDSGSQTLPLQQNLGQGQVPSSETLAVSGTSSSKTGDLMNVNTELQGSNITVPIDESVLEYLQTYLTEQQLVQVIMWIIENQGKSLDTSREQVTGTPRNRDTDVQVCVNPQPVQPSGQDDEDAMPAMSTSRYPQPVHQSGQDDEDTMPAVSTSGLSQFSIGDYDINSGEISSFVDSLMESNSGN